MPRWSNWSGKNVAKPQGLHFVRSLDDASAIIAAATKAGRPVRFAGSGHSHAALVPTGGDIIDTSGLAGISSVDVENQTARILGGSKLYALGAPLHAQGLGLINQGDIDRQALAGVVATGTHGTGRTLKNFSAQVLGFTLITASGDQLKCNATENHEIWQAARLGLGAFGFMGEIELQLRDAYRLEEKTWEEELPSLATRVDALAGATRHFEFFWFPQTDMAFSKSLTETKKPARYPLGDEGARCAWSYEVLANHRPVLHTEMEYSVPEAQGLDCLMAIRALIGTQFPDLKWPVEFRTLAADDVWLSSAFERSTVTLSVHQGIDEDDAPLFRACEKIFIQYGGRPHWGKVHYLEGKALGKMHPRWEEWWKLRDSLDPQGTFLNEPLRLLRPA